MENSARDMLSLLKRLSDIFGPSGCEERVAKAILEEADGYYDEYIKDTLGGVILKLCAKTPQKAPLMLSAHMDEVGFMISDIDEYGYLHFQNVGGISDSVLPSRRVYVEANDNTLISGVIASKAIHLQSKEERQRPYKPSELLIDIGAADRDDAKKYVSVGAFATFEPDYLEFGENSPFIRSKALDDRFGCTVLLTVMQKLYASKEALCRDVYFAFTTREELGLSGALTAANRIGPEYALILETTAISDIAETPAELSVAEAGCGGCVSFADRSTVYDERLVKCVLEISKEKGIPAQIKRFVSGGNDAGHIHKSGSGVKTVAISAPTRYLHSPSCVIAASDLFAVEALALETARELAL